MALCSCGSPRDGVRGRGGDAGVSGGRGRGGEAAETAAALTCTGAVADVLVVASDGGSAAACKWFEEDVRDLRHCKGM